MLYTLEQGQAEQKIIEQCMRERLPLPKRIRNAPALRMGLELFYSAFLDLHSCRSAGWGAGPIPWSAIADWAGVNQLDEEQTEDLFYHVRALDDAFLAYNEQRQEAQRKANKPPKKGRSK